jgi:hypothetical protein
MSVLDTEHVFNMKCYSYIDMWNCNMKFVYSETGFVKFQVLVVEFRYDFVWSVILMLNKYHHE